MKKSVFSIPVIFLFVGLLVTPVSAFAGADELKERFKDRLPVIKELKDKGVVGENNKGYLEFVGGKQERPDVVSAENNDRRIVYTAIAKKQGTTADVVGTRRALQIAEIASPGEMLQKADGTWYRK